MKTKVFEDEFKDQPMFAVFKVDEDGKKGEKDKPVVSMGIKKAKFILKHFKELKDYVEENE